MLYAKFQDRRPLGSGKEDFLKVFTIYGHGGHLGHVTCIIYIHFRSPFLYMLPIKFGFDWQRGFRKKIFENRGRRTTDGRTIDIL